MLTKLRSISSAHVIAMAAVFIAVGGTAYSVSKIDSRDVANNSLKSVDLKNNKAVKSVDVRDGSLTGVDLDESTLATVPAASSSDSAGKAENVLSAAVNADGTLARAGQPGTTSVRLTGGQYEVDFGRDVANCVWVGGVASVTAPTTDGQAQIGPSTGNAEAIFVLTTDSTGNITDKPFQVVVVC